jgi:leucyl-tRNA synthetase
VEESELPLRLPDLADFKPGDDPAGPLARAVDWRYFQKDGKWYARETNTMPQWAGSCWYYLRFTDPHNDEAAGRARPTTRGCLSTSTSAAPSTRCCTCSTRASGTRCSSISGFVKHPEPFMKLVHQGMILGEVEYTLYRGPGGELVDVRHVKITDDGLRHHESDLELSAVRVAEGELEKQGTHFHLKSHPTIRVSAQSFKMSKSRGNVVNPDDVVKAHGADVMRLYEMFMGPLEAMKPWQTSQISGIVRFRDKVWSVAQRCRARVDRRGDEAPPAQDDQEGERRHRGLGLQHRHQHDDGAHQQPRRAQGDPGRRSRR